MKYSHNAGVIGVDECRHTSFSVVVLIVFGVEEIAIALLPASLTWRLNTAHWGELNLSISCTVGSGIFYFPSIEESVVLTLRG